MSEYDMNSNIMNNAEIPTNVMEAISGEATDFVVKAKRKTATGSSILGIVFALFWLGISGFIMAMMLGPLLKGKSVPITINGVRKVGLLQNIGPLTFPLIFISIFVLIGLIILIFSIVSIFKKGGWFAGTKNRLIIVGNKGSQSIDWEQFSGNIKVSGTNENGSLILEMRTGRMVHSRNRGSHYVPNKIAMIGIQNVYEIEKICRKYIKANDPSPARNI